MSKLRAKIQVLVPVRLLQHWYDSKGSTHLLRTLDTDPTNKSIHARQRPRRVEAINAGRTPKPYSRDSHRQASAIAVARNS